MSSYVRDRERLYKDLGVQPGQLHPNVWRSIVIHYWRCQELGIEASYKDFKLCVDVKVIVNEVGLQGFRAVVRSKWKHRDHVPEWRRRWFLVLPPPGMAQSTAPAERNA